MNLEFAFNAVSSVWKIMNYSTKSHLIKDSGIKERILRIKPWHVENFFKIIDEDLEDFLSHDKCCRMADNYLIAMVFVYFIRANLEPEDYTSLNFIAALHLALDMEEDDDEIHKELQTWSEINEEIPDILEVRNRFFQRIGYRGAISRKCCDSIMQKINPKHHVWKRKRHINHSGALSDYSRKRSICPMCI